MYALGQGLSKVTSGLSVELIALMAQCVPLG